MVISVENGDYALYFEKNILFLEYRTNRVTSEIATNIINDKLQIVKYKEYPTIILMNSVLKVDSEARKILSTEEGNKGISKCAVVSQSKLTVVTVNFFVKVNKPKVPMKLFMNIDDAKKWILQ